MKEIEIEACGQSDLSALFFRRLLLYFFQDYVNITNTGTNEFVSCEFDGQVIRKSSPVVNASCSAVPRGCLPGLNLYVVSHLFIVTLATRDRFESVIL